MDMPGDNDAGAESEALPLRDGSTKGDDEPLCDAKADVSADCEAKSEPPDVAEFGAEAEMEDEAERKAVDDPLVHTDIESEATRVLRGESELLLEVDDDGRGDAEGDGRAVGVGITRLIRALVVVAGVFPLQITAPVLATRSSTSRFADLDA